MPHRGIAQQQRGHPPAIDTHIHNPDDMDGVWALVSVDISKLSGKSKRINLTLPERLLARMDCYAAEHSQSRSGLIVETAMTYLSRSDKLIQAGAGLYPALQILRHHHRHLRRAYTGAHSRS